MLPIGLCFTLNAYLPKFTSWLPMKWLILFSETLPNNSAVPTARIQMHLLHNVCLSEYIGRLNSLSLSTLVTNSVCLESLVSSLKEEGSILILSRVAKSDPIT